MHERANENIAYGVRQGSTGAGCVRTRFGQSSEDDTDPQGDAFGQQDVFGGRGRTEATPTQDTEACTYQHTGCYCCPYDNNGNQLLQPVTVTAERRPITKRLSVVTCKRGGCGAYMLLNAEGNPIKIDRGAIFKTAQQQKVPAQAAAPEPEVAPVKQGENLRDDLALAS